MISKIFSLRNYVMKQIMKPNKEGIMQIPNKGKVDFGEMIIKEQLFNKGIDPKAITSERQLDNILNTPNVAPKSPPKKSGEVINVDFDKGRWKDTDPEDFAHGGRSGSGLNYLLGEDDQNVRVPFKDGTKFDPKRRGFLKVAAGLATLPFIGKYFKWAKPLAKTAKVADLTSVPIKNIEGMPAWFKPLVNKVIKEGEEVLSEGDRIITHKTTLPNSKTDVYVTQDLNTGNVIADIGMGKHGFADGHLGQPVRLEYKASEWIEPTHIENIKKGDVSDLIKGMRKKPGKPTKTKEEFWVEEAEFTGGHPENVKFEESTFEKFGEHGSNFDEVEKFATGTVKKKTAKESIKAERAHWTPEDDYASGGRVPFIFGGGAIKNVFKRLKDMRKMPRTEKMMKPNPNFQHLLSEADKLELSALKVEHAEAMLDMLKSDRQLFLQFQSNKAMKDEGLDFLMKKMIEPMAPHINDYKSLKEIDEAILNMEMIVKNKALKEGRQLNATGGRVPLAGGKLAQTLIQQIIKKYKGRIDDKLLKQMLVDDNPQRLAEVMATIDEALLMQGKGMGPETIMQTMRESWKRKKNASGGLAGMLGE